MAQYIKQGNIFGRIGSGLAQGLAEQVPKEMENSRLRTGLKALADQADRGDLSPAQFLAQASGTYGITPQMVQSFGELAKVQNKSNAYRNAAGDQGYPRSSPDLRPGQENRVIDQIANGGNEMQQNQNMPMQPGAHHGQRTPNVRPGQNIPEIATKNPLDPAATPRVPWTRQQKLDSINHYNKMGFLNDAAEKLTAEDEAADLAEPGALQQRNDYLESLSEKARGELTRHLETKLQKKGEDVYKDLPGEYKIAMERGMERDLRLNPNRSLKDVADDWSDRALFAAKAKNELKGLAAESGIETIWKGQDTLQKLKANSDYFRDFGNSEEYYNILRKDFGLSDQGAALIAYPPSKKINEYANSFKPSSAWFRNSEATSIPQQIESSARKAAVEVGKIIDTNDSLLAIARTLSERDPNFDQGAFFAQLDEDKGQLRLNDRQRREIPVGKRDILPTWGDIKIFPWGRRSTK